ncbi:MAG: glycosyltransferase [Methyloprofundus sp.]|nr:glycosyltransferase [Methyloprofundus sp.]
MTLINESSYLPPSTSELPEGPWLVLAPHPDDETFGMGGSILLALAAKIIVDVIFLTDGRAADLDDKELTTKREKEAKLACQQLGIRNTLFWREIDRELSTSQHLINRLSDFVAKHQYTTVFFPSPQEPHPDHRITAVLAWESLRQLNFTARPVSYEISLQAHTNHLIDISQVISQKEKIMACYVSQMGSNHYIERILGLNQSRAWSLPLSVSHAEAFYAWPKEDRPLNALLLSVASQQYSLQALPNSLPLVSVIIRTQDRPEFLREAIRSVATQTYPNIELIVINDGGRNTLQLVQEEAIGHIQSFQYEQLEVQTGRSHAANAGLKCSQGELLIFLDDDDLFLPEHIHKLASTIIDRPEIKVVYTGVQCIDEHKNVLPIHFSAPFNANRLISGNYIPIHSALFSRSLLDLGCKIDESLKVYEDWDFWIQASMFTSFLFIDGFSAFYRNTGQSEVGINSQDKFKKKQACLPLFKKWLPRLANEQLLDLMENLEQSYPKEHQLQVQSEIIKQQEVIIKNLKQEISSKELKTQASLVHIEQLLNSTSWRITQPLRMLSQYFKNNLS